MPDPVRSAASPGDGSGALAINETDRMIASDRVEGASVYDKAAVNRGSVNNVMIDKFFGRIANVVISCGGFLGIGTDYYPLPWQKLTYDRIIGGYAMDLTPEQLARAPRYPSDQVPWTEPGYRPSAYDYYEVPYYL